MNNQQFGEIIETGANLHTQMRMTPLTQTFASSFVYLHKSQGLINPGANVLNRSTEIGRFLLPQAAHYSDEVSFQNTE